MSLVVQLQPTGALIGPFDEAKKAEKWANTYLIKYSQKYSSYKLLYLIKPETVYEVRDFAYNSSKIEIL